LSLLYSTTLCSIVVFVVVAEPIVDSFELVVCELVVEPKRTFACYWPTVAFECMCPNRMSHDVRLRSTNYVRISRKSTTFV
jgi:hypothetical protein